MRWTRSYDVDDIFLLSSAKHKGWSFDIAHYGRGIYSFHAWKVLQGKALNGADSGRIDYTLHFNRLKDAKAAAERIASNREG